MALPTPLAYWPLNEGNGTDLADATGNGHGATVTNGTWVAGKFGAGLGNSSDSHAATFTAIALALLYSVSLWIKGWDGSNDGVVIGGAAGHYAFYLDATTIYHSASSSFTSVAHGGGLSDGAWHHLAVTRNAGNMQFYKDGVPLGASQTIGNANVLTLSSLLGYAGGTYGFVAQADDVRLYDVELTTAQIAELAALVPAGGCPALLLAV